MKFIKKYVLVSHCCVLLIGLFCITPLIAQEVKFTVVLDAGHGGHDPGAIGSFSREKDLNLAVTLQLGAIIEQKFKDVNVIFSRKSDKYLTLQERADVVNNHHADLFICIHTNSAQSSSAYGAESFTLGLAKTKANLDVAMRENSVITLEENYKTKYHGFDPNSVDSYIMFEFMQDKYIDRSVEFASTIQKQFKSYCSRADRGVRQAGFWVLHRSACPSVLVELGFISNPAEERYLNSDIGQKEMATAIFNAFVDYKREHDKKSGRQTSQVYKVEPTVKTEEISKPQIKPKEDSKPIIVEVKPIVQDTTTPEPKTKNLAKKTAITKPIIVETQTIEKSVQNESKTVDLDTVFKSIVQKKPENNSTIPVFKVQLLASAKSLKPTASDFKNIKNIDSFVEGGLNKYTIGTETNYSKIEKIRQEILTKFPEAFIIAFVGKKKITAKEALKLIQ